MREFTKAGFIQFWGGGNLGAYKYSGDYFNPNPNPFIHTWSLAVEEQIYIALPLFLFLTIRIFKKIKIRLVLTLLTLTSTCLFWNSSLTDSLFSKIGIEYASLLNLPFYLPTHRFWEFGIGAIASCIRSENRLSRFPGTILMSLILLILALPSTAQTMSSSTALCVVLVALFFQLVLCQASNDKTSLVYATLKYFGDRSYSIYLVHMPIVYILLVSPLIPNKLQALPQFLLYLALIYFLGIKLLFPIEKRYRLSYLSTGSK